MRIATRPRRASRSPAVLTAGSVSAEAERILYFALMSAIDAGLIRTMEDALKVLRHASQPLGPIGAEWLERQEQKLKGQDLR